MGAGPVLPGPAGVARGLLALLARAELLLRRHVLLAPDAEVALDGAAAHGTAVELAEAGGADAGVPAGQQGPGQGEVLADDAELLAGGVPEGALGLVGPRGDQGVPRARAVARAGLGQGQGRAQARRHARLVVVARVARRQVQLL